MVIGAFSLYSRLRISLCSNWVVQGGLFYTVTHCFSRFSHRCYSRGCQFLGSPEEVGANFSDIVDKLFQWVLCLVVHFCTPHVIMYTFHNYKNTYDNFGRVTIDP